MQHQPQAGDLIGWGRRGPIYLIGGGSEAPPEPDGDKPDDPEPTSDPKPDDDQDDSKDAKSDKDQAAELAKWKSLARQHEKQSKANAAAAKKLADIEEQAKTDQQKAADKAAAAEERAAKQLARAVKAEVRAMSADEFADPGDAALYLDLTKYVSADGDDIDAAAIKADLAEVLEKKPHLRKAKDEQKKKPKPDASQGAKTAGAQRPTSLNEAVSRAFQPR